MNRFMAVVLFFLSASALLDAKAQELGFHKWTSSGSRYSTRAKLLRKEVTEGAESLLVLEKEDGSVVRVSVNRLSGDSQELAERLLGRKKAALNEEDRKELIRHLEALSKGWVQESVDSANPLLWKSEYSREHWKTFFSDFFADHLFTEDLRNYLQYPVFGWGPRGIHRNLQEGLALALEELLLRSLEKGSENLGAALNDDSDLLTTLCKVTLFLNQMAGSKHLSPEMRRRLYATHRNLILKHPGLRASHTIDVAEYPYQGRIRGQLYINLLEFAIPDVHDPKKLTLRALSPEVREEIATTLALTGPRRDLWLKHSLLVIDNNGFDVNQYAALSRTLDLVPPKLHNLGIVTVRECIGKDVDFYRHNVGRVNIAMLRIGTATGNGFADDVAPHRADTFWNIWVHELNHIVDAYYVGHDDPYRKLLIEEAGSVSKNYLRSMFGEDIFVKAPQEFFASIANQYFANSQRTLELGIARFQQGHKEPLRQFLLYANVYSLGEDHTYFFTIDAEGQFDRRSIPLTRDENGLIKNLKMGDSRYRFVRDAKGGLLDWELQPTSLDLE